MKSFKLSFTLIVLILAFVLSSCFNSPPSEVDYYYMPPSDLLLTKGIPDTSYYKNIFLLTAVKSDTVITEDTTFTMGIPIITKKMFITNSCNFQINSQNYTINEGDTLAYGNPLVGGTYSRIRFSCDYINIPQESVDFTVWLKRFTQDCSNWN